MTFTRMCEREELASSDGTTELNRHGLWCSRAGHPMNNEDQDASLSAQVRCQESGDSREDTCLQLAIS
jgi:hypothetical protein